VGDRDAAWRHQPPDVIIDGSIDESIVSDNRLETLPGDVAAGDCSRHLMMGRGADPAGDLRVDALRRATLADPRRAESHKEVVRTALQPDRAR